jgi:SSS family solute:Na+ symporter
MDIHFGVLNAVVLGAYLVGMVAIGIGLAGRQHTGEDYFLAGRRMPWLAVAMSMFASLTSAITFMGLPAAAYAENVALLVVCVVSPLLVPLLVLVLYPAYRRHGVTTSYEYIGLRYGPAGRYAVAVLFLLARLGWLGTVIYAPALALSVTTGIPLWAAIVLMGVMATFYTVLGGLSAVIWTDVAQFVILVAGAIWVAVTLTASVPGGVLGILRAAGEGEHLRLVSWRLSLTEMTGFAVAISFFLQMLQDYGTDQVSVQRMLAVKDARGMTRAAIFNAGTDVIMIATLLYIGLGLFAFYQQHPETQAALSADSVLPHFIITQLPAGVSGLLISAIFAAAMSSMDSGINSLATVVENDLVTPFRQRAPSPERVVLEARILSCIFGVLATGLAFGTSRLGHIIQAFATYMSLFNAPVLALFILGFVSRGANFRGWLVGALVSIPATLWLQRSGVAHWVYFFPFSFATTFAIGWLASQVLPGKAYLLPTRPTP